MGTESREEFHKRFVAAMERKAGTKRMCPVCGGTRWGVDPDGVALLKGNVLPLDIETAHALPLIFTACENCGFVRMHVRDVLFDEEDG